MDIWGDGQTDRANFYFCVLVCQFPPHLSNQSTDRPTYLNQSISQSINQSFDVLTCLVHGCKWVIGYMRRQAAVCTSALVLFVRCVFAS